MTTTWDTKKINRHLDRSHWFWSVSFKISAIVPFRLLCVSKPSGWELQRPCRFMWALELSIWSVTVSEKRLHCMFSCVFAQWTPCCTNDDMKRSEALLKQYLKVKSQMKSGVIFLSALHKVWLHLTMTLVAPWWELFTSSLCFTLLISSLFSFLLFQSMWQVLYSTCLVTASERN